MSKLAYLAAAMAALSLAGCATAPAEDDFDIFSGGRAPPAQVEAAARGAAKHPLGSRENPIRVNMPQGQRVYLGRLRCSDGAAPTFFRAGSFGPGVYGSIIDGYQVTCEGGEPKSSMIFMDMYHPNYFEKSAPPGFTLKGQ